MQLLRFVEPEDLPTFFGGPCVHAGEGAFSLPFLALLLPFHCLSLRFCRPSLAGPASTQVRKRDNGTALSSRFCCILPKTERRGRPPRLPRPLSLVMTLVRGREPTPFVALLLSFCQRLVPLPVVLPVRVSSAHCLL